MAPLTGCSVLHGLSVEERWSRDSPEPRKEPAMPAESCAPCEAHAELHSSNILGIGSANDPCGQCEAHAQLHSGGCGGLLLVSLVTAGVLLARKKT